MHVPDGFFDAPTSVATGVATAVVIGVSLRKARGELDDRTAPLVGLVAAFVFATQMLNFPTGLGPSGHLMGGAIAAVLVGPWTGILCVSVVLIVQALLFADGGITALGTNVGLIGVATVVVGWGVFRGLQAVLPKTVAMVPVCAAVGAFVSVPIASLVFVGLYAVGGAKPDNFSEYFAAGCVGFGLGTYIYTPGMAAETVAERARAAVAAYEEGLPK